jgi:hypothetical protein
MSADGFLGTGPARADYQSFCSQKLLAPGSRGRCSFPAAFLNQVHAYSYSINTSHCAVGKQNDDGGGPNVITPNCGTAQSLNTPCQARSFGYPYIINQASFTAQFDGSVAYNDQCIP